MAKKMTKCKECGMEMGIDWLAFHMKTHEKHLSMEEIMAKWR